jgi:hypothetical protein
MTKEENIAESAITDVSRANAALALEIAVARIIELERLVEDQNAFLHMLRKELIKKL